MIQLTLTLKMTTAQVVETSVTVNNSPIQDYVHPDDQTQPTFKRKTLSCKTLSCIGRQFQIMDLVIVTETIFHVKMCEPVNIIQKVAS